MPEKTGKTGVVIGQEGGGRALVNGQDSYEFKNIPPTSHLQSLRCEALR